MAETHGTGERGESGMNIFMRMAKGLRRLLQNGTINYTCDVCGREVFGGERICAHCRERLPVPRVVCPVCGRRVEEEGVCASCKQRRPVPNMVRSRFVHEGDALRLMLRYKGGERYLAQTFALELLPLLEAFPRPDALVPVPMTARERRRRGFDQARLLAERLSAQSGIPVLCAAEKTRETAQQKTLSRRERETNLRGCFRVADRKCVRGKRLLIVDDIYTTGATADEFASVLLRAGAAAVDVITVTSVPSQPTHSMPPKDTSDGTSRTK